MPKAVFYILTGIQLEENTEVLSFLSVLKQKQNPGFLSHYKFTEQEEMQKKPTETLRPLQWLTEQTLGGRKGSAARPVVCSSLVEPLALGCPRATSPSLLIHSRPALRPRQAAAACPHSYLTPEVPSRQKRGCTICHPEPTMLRCFPLNPHLA